MLFIFLVLLVLLMVLVFFMFSVSLAFLSVWASFRLITPTTATTANCFAGATKLFTAFKLLPHKQLSLTIFFKMWSGVYFGSFLNRNEEQVVTHCQNGYSTENNKRSLPTMISMSNCLISIVSWRNTRRSTSYCWCQSLTMGRSKPSNCLNDSLTATIKTAGDVAELMPVPHKRPSV